jgi:HK97 family phage portal protein
MANPLTAAWDWLHGADLNAPGGTTEHKLFTYDDVGAAIRSGMLIHGPGATQAIERAWGVGEENNSAAFACLAAISTAFAEAPLRVYRGSATSNQIDPVIDHPLERLFERPNPYMSGPVLWSWVQWVKHVNGNAYLRKIRSGNPLTGNVVELWPISPLRIVPRTEKGSANFIDAYRYQYAPGKYEDIPPENIVHLRLGLDDRDLRVGLSPLLRLWREIAGDDEASAWQSTMLANGGAAGMLVIPPAGSTMTPAEAEALRDRIAARFSGDGRGKVGVLSPGSDMKQYGFSPDQMDMKALHRVPEERIAAVLRVPAIIAGLGAGLDRSTYANFREAREMFTEQTILPLYAFDAATITHQLLPEFTNDRALVAAFDIANLRALQDDQNALYTRMDKAVLTGWVLPNEARAAVGLPPMDGGDVPMPKPQPFALPGGKARPVYEIKAGDVANLPELLQALVDLAEPDFERQMQEHFDRQHAHVRRALTGS